MTLFIALGLFLAAPPFMSQPLTPENRARLDQGEIIRQCEREQGTQSAGYAIGVFQVPLETMWQALVSLPLYDEFVERTTVSVLLDEKTKDQVVAGGLDDADAVEKLFAGNDPNFSKPDPFNPERAIVYSYQRNTFPWPVSDRWVLLEMNHDPRNHIQSWKRLAGNIREDHGVWRLEPYGPDRTLGILEIHVDLAIPATGPFTDFAMNLSLPETYRGFENIARSLMKKSESGAGR
jgi:hypothetical protein